MTNRRSAKLLILPIGLAILAFGASLGIAAPAALACDDVHGWVEKYQSAEATDKTRQAALGELSGPCRGYVAVTSDELLFEVLQDALRRRYDKALVQGVFTRYRCIPGVAELEGYSVLARALDTASCPTKADMKKWFVVAVSGALLRSGPSKRRKKVGHVKMGIIVEMQSKAGDWLKVKTWRNQTGYIHQSLLAIY